MRYRRSQLSEIPDWKLQAFALTLVFLGGLSKAIPALSIVTGKQIGRAHV